MKKQPLMVLYDVPDDNLRHRVSEACKDYGLERIQYSAFLGQLTRNRAEELAQRLKREVREKDATIHLFSLYQEQVAGSLLVQNQNDRAAPYRS